MNVVSAENMKVGDVIVCYVTKVSRFCAVMKIIGERYESNKIIWTDMLDICANKFPSKVKVYRQNCFDGTHIKDTWDNLDFISNKNKCGRTQVMVAV